MDAVQTLDMVSDDELAEVAATWVAAARDAWPAIELDEAAFVAEVKARLAEDVTVERARAVHAADLWIAIACGQGNPAALIAFDDAFLSPMATWLGSNHTADQVEDVRQEVRSKLLVAEGEEPPRICDYSGRADLRTWIRTTAVRTAIDLMRKRREVPLEDEEDIALPVLADDPELAHLKERYRGELRSAIHEAIGSLSPRDRLLLKYHYVDGFGIDKLASIYRVHRATAARWLGAAREALAAQSHERLIQGLGVTSGELRSIARLVESQLDISLHRLLA